MFDTINHIASESPRQNGMQARSVNVFQMVKNDRMGGSVPAWKPPGEDSNSVTVALTDALSQNASQNGRIDNALALQSGHGMGTARNNEEFGFADLVDMLNPLQHIPLVGNIYRSITGDTIKPIGRIVGGGIFGGPLGAASGLINVIAEKETGADLTGNAYNALIHGKAPSFRKLGNDPESTLAQAQKLAQNQPEPLPESLLAFTNQNHNGIRINRGNDRLATADISENLPAAQEPAIQIQSASIGIDRSQKVPFRDI